MSVWKFDYFEPSCVAGSAIVSAVSSYFFLLASVICMGLLGLLIVLAKVLMTVGLVVVSQMFFYVTCVFGKQDMFVRT